MKFWCLRPMNCTLRKFCLKVTAAYEWHYGDVTYRLLDTIASEGYFTYFVGWFDDIAKLYVSTMTFKWPITWIKVSNKRSASRYQYAVSPKYHSRDTYWFWYKNNLQTATAKFWCLRIVTVKIIMYHFMASLSIQWKSEKKSA